MRINRKFARGGVGVLFFACFQVYGKGPPLIEKWVARQARSVTLLVLRRAHTI